MQQIILELDGFRKRVTIPQYIYNSGRYEMILYPPLTAMVINNEKTIEDDGGTKVMFVRNFSSDSRLWKYYEGI